MTEDSRHLDPEPDILQVVLDRVRAATPNAISDSQAATIEQQIRAELGGLRVRIPKRRKHPTAEQRQAIFDEALKSGSDQDLIKKYRIGRATLYRYMKAGG